MDQAPTVTPEEPHPFHFLWGQPFLRTSALIFGVGNFLGPGLLLILVVEARRQGWSATGVGALVSVFAVGLLLGSFLSPVVRRVLPVRAVLVLELWMGFGCGLFLVWPNAWVLAAGMLPSALAIPSTDSVVHGYRIAITPDHLLGRSEAIRSTMSLLIAPLGPLVAAAGRGLGSHDRRLLRCRLVGSGAVGNT